ncbi:hypothetical protein L2E82_19125 [Cichorium intybus]|uniref:Uncharacterized protein n=1 Tax=Cichorium intybus TaxID=13427 RepID=A0ACB9FCM8_CICIN|nr:hypothetical protein L2E82_19125 [Cichorium intybus]
MSTFQFRTYRENHFMIFIIYESRSHENGFLGIFTVIASVDDKTHRQRHRWTPSPRLHPYPCESASIQIVWLLLIDFQDLTAKTWGFLYISEDDDCEWKTPERKEIEKEQQTNNR